MIQLKSLQDRNSLLKELDIADLPADLQDKVLVQLGENIIMSITATVASKLSEEENEEFRKLIESNDEEKLQAFLQSRVNNLDGLIEEKTKEEIENCKKLFQD